MEESQALIYMNFRIPVLIVVGVVSLGVLNLPASLRGYHKGHRHTLTRGGRWLHSFSSVISTHFNFRFLSFLVYIPWTFEKFDLFDFDQGL